MPLFWSDSYKDVNAPLHRDKNEFIYLRAPAIISPLSIFFVCSLGGYKILNLVEILDKVVREKILLLSPLNWLPLIYEHEIIFKE